MLLTCIISITPSNKLSKAFWKGLKAIISPKDNSIENIHKDEWINHFDKVLNEPVARGHDKQFLEYVKTSLPTLENITPADNTLNQPITDSEITSTIRGLKNGKAVFIDNIGNEALRHGHAYFKESFGVLKYFLRRQLRQY